MFSMFSQKEKSFIIVVLGLLLAVLLVACQPTAAAPGAAQSATGEGGITVVGRGEAFGAPDRAELNVGVETFAEVVEEATSQNQATVESIMAALEAEGIAREDIQTSNYSLWAEQIYGDRGPEGIAGYRVSNQVNVTLRDIERVGDVIAAVTGAGANNIHGVSFRVADPAALEAEARAEAIANARERAESLAELSGVELGEIVVISEVIGQSGVSPFGGRGLGGGAMAEDAAAPGISPGELSVGVEVQVTFALR